MKAVESLVICGFKRNKPKLRTFFTLEESDSVVQPDKPFQAWTTWHNSIMGLKTEARACYTILCHPERAVASPWLRKLTVTTLFHLWRLLAWCSPFLWARKAAPIWTPTFLFELPLFLRETYATTSFGNFSLYSRIHPSFEMHFIDWDRSLCPTLIAFVISKGTKLWLSPRNDQNTVVSGGQDYVTAAKCTFNIFPLLLSFSPYIRYIRG